MPGEEQIRNRSYLIDAAGEVTDQPSLEIAAEAPSELILVDVPMTFRPVGIWAGQDA